MIFWRVRRKAARTSIFRARGRGRLRSAPGGLTLARSERMCPSMTISGYTAQGFSAVRSAFETNFREGREHGASFAVWLGDELIVDLRGGFSDREGLHDWTARTLCPV